jgi:hypothetical protein
MYSPTTLDKWERRLLIAKVKARIIILGYYLEFSNSAASI